jgi:hypothetical protein
MAEEAHYGLMVWDGRSVGTLMSVQRLSRQGKSIALYSIPEGRFTDIKGAVGWQAFAACRPPHLRARIEREAAIERARIRARGSRLLPVTPRPR